MQLYIHVPFCRSKCLYCSFYSVPIGSDAALVREYVDTLLAEIAFWGDRLGKARMDTVFFGGGTPSLLPAKAVAIILDRVRRAFDLSPHAEISLEANPESFLAIGFAHEAASAGITRLSLGVQSLDDALLARLGRPHSERQALAAYDAARSAGFASVGMDLIWGLPGQRNKDWLLELARVAAMQPDHLSCYGLTLEEGTPLAHACACGEVALPSEKEQASMYLDGAAYLESQGLLQYEISNFARMGFQCRHNLGYWEGQPYLGLGPAATSTISNRRWTNPQSIGGWMDGVRSGRVADNAEQLTPLVRVLENVMLRLRTARGLRLKAYREITGRDFVKDNKLLVHALHREGLLRIRNGYVRLTRNGMLVSDNILAHLFESLETKLLQEHENTPSSPKTADSGFFPLQP